MSIARGLLAGALLIASVLQPTIVEALDGEPLSTGGGRSGTGGAGTVKHAPIVIQNDTNFTSENGVFSGSGSFADPYIIEGWEIDTFDSPGISITNTSAHFILRDCHIHGNHSQDGIVFRGVVNGTIKGNYVCANKNGITITSGHYREGAKSCRFENNAFVSNAKAGMNFTHLGGSHRYNTISNNNISNNGLGIYSITFGRNNITFNHIANNKGFGMEMDMCMGGGSENIIHHNNLIGNNGGNEQAIDTSDGNSWNDTSQGNFWSDWVSPDQNGDGIVDLPHEFNHSATDHYPLARAVAGMDYPSGPPPGAPHSEPPAIFGLCPAGASFLNDSRPLICASFSDEAGIDAGSLLVLLDGWDVTRNATADCGSVRYVPPVSLPDGDHTVQVRVADNSSRHNFAIVKWNFTIQTSVVPPVPAPDTLPPVITGHMPFPSTLTNAAQPEIRANYSDASGIDLTAVSLTVDGRDVTKEAVLYHDRITYRPAAPLAPGEHFIFLNVTDLSRERNSATARWNFTLLAPEAGNPITPDRPTMDTSTGSVSTMVGLAFGVALAVVLYLNNRKR
jgi:hypothetical protein